MRKKAHIKNGKFMAMLLAVLMICSILPIQVYALQNDSALIVIKERTAEDSADAISEEVPIADDPFNADEGEINALEEGATADKDSSDQKEPTASKEALDVNLDKNNVPVLYLESTPDEPEATVCIGSD